MHEGETSILLLTIETERCLIWRATQATTMAGQMSVRPGLVAPRTLLATFGRAIHLLPPTGPFSVAASASGLGRIWMLIFDEFQLNSPKHTRVPANPHSIETRADKLTPVSSVRQ